MSDTEKLLNDIRVYLRISAAAASRAIAKTTLDTYEKALVYSKFDGRTAQTKIEQDTKVPQKTISNWLAGFVQAGLVSPPDKYNNSHKALFTLQELDIQLNTLKSRAKASKQPKEHTQPPSQKAAVQSQKEPIQKVLEHE